MHRNNCEKGTCQRPLQAIVIWPEGLEASPEIYAIGDSLEQANAVEKHLKERLIDERR